MDKYSVAQAADILGISKEAVYNRIRRNTLNSVLENGVKYVVLDDQMQKKKPQKAQTKPKQSPDNDKYIDLLLEQIQELKENLSSLENDKKTLIKEKEDLLIESKNEVERIYTQRDKQLKQIVALVTRPLMTYMKNKNEIIDARLEELSPYERGLVLKTEVDRWINVEEYMEKKGYSDKKKKNVRKQLTSKLGSNKNVKEEDGFLFIKRGVKIKQIIRKKS
ncbi:MAG: hypothetical protein CR967_04255 [Proteobacteria bacterium]|nr:MAG: hypothetical protein CR967_04255 [Pseudomonadota bacterium]